VVLTGAGVSAESGIPTFRDALTGLWANFDASRLASEGGFLADPPLVWGWYEWRRKKVLQTKTTPAHLAIAQLADLVPKLTLITQNVDDLHERAGSQNVLHLHGSIHQPYCLICGEPYSFCEENELQPDINPESRIDPPKCHLCGESVRPGVVWFGESLPQIEWHQAQQASVCCDLMLIVGTSGMVYPAANLRFLADKEGISIAQINPVITGFNSVAGHNLVGKAGDVLPKLVNATFHD
jgi:NAD-dependent deacetylase